MKRLIFIIFIIAILHSVFFETQQQIKLETGLSIYQNVSIAVLSILIIAVIIASRIIKYKSKSTSSIIRDRQKSDPNITAYGTVKRR